MARKEILVSKTGGKINATGMDALSALLDSKENIVIGASAGTGKTTLLTNIIAEYVIRKASSGQNPFDKIVATTFTVEAARQIKEKVRKRLSSFNKDPKYGPLPSYDSIIYSLEAESWIFTIDALTLKLAKMMSLDLGISPGVEIIDEFTNNELIEKVLDSIKAAHVDEYTQLETVFGADLQDLLTSALDLISTFLISTKSFDGKIGKSLDLFYQNSNFGQAIQLYNRQVLDNVKTILASFVKEYRKLLDDNSVYTYSEIRRRVVEFLKSKKSNKWRSYLGDRIQLLLVDEFQDTSVAQVKLLSSIAGQSTSILLIGDAKQSIYTWRNAAPTIIMDIIDSASKKQPSLDKHFKKQFRYFEISENYRSLSDLIELQNHFFSNQNSDSIFQKPLYTKTMKVPNPAVTCNTQTPSVSVQPPHIHHYIVKDMGKGDKMHEEQYIVAELQKIAIGKSKLKVRKEIQDSNSNQTWKWITPKLGDCSILMPRRSKWLRLRELLLDVGIPYVMIKDQGFYHRPEITLIIDFLDWLGNPFQRDALIRILRSPFIGASDALIRTLIDSNFRFDLTEQKIENQLIATTNKSKKDILDRDLIALKRVANLKNNLRWSREGKKSTLIEEILRTSHFREILMMYFEGDQCVANLNLLTDTINSWEEEEIISYPELIQRLKFYRSAPAATQSQAFLSDLENERAVKISSIHSTKGLEFPIVFIYTVTRSLVQEWSDRNRSTRIGTPRLWYNDITGKFIHLRQFPSAGSTYETRQRLSHVYSKAYEYLAQTTLTPFQKEMEHICRENYAEKMRLYYVAVTRARDHLFQG
ncbi:MAG: UvrD-helicase domain-containing protein, partial [Candidatus Thorarchaeota archaeon]